MVGRVPGLIFVAKSHAFVYINTLLKHRSTNGKQVDLDGQGHN